MTAAAEAPLLNVVMPPGYEVPHIHGDEHWACYLIAPFAQGLYPAQIWHLRRSATRYRPGGAR